MEFSETLESPRNLLKNQAGIGKVPMYSLVHQNTPLFEEWVKQFKTDPRTQRKDYLFQLKIGEMTGKEYEEYLNLIGR